MKHEYTFEELAELRKIYDESGEAGLDITEMRALRKAGLLTQGLPAKPSKRDLILAHCKKRIDQGQPFDRAETAEALGLSPKTVGNIISQLRNDGLLPATPVQRKPRKTTEKKETIMTATVQEQKPQSEPEDPRAIIANRLGTLHDAMLGIMSASFDAGDKVAYAYACKLLSGEIMDLKANYSKDTK